MGRRDNIDAFRNAMRPAPEEGAVGQEKKMSYLKGNYNVKKPVEGPADEKKVDESSTTAFEKFARERLGGSIAFVMKKNTFVWQGPGKDGCADDSCAKDEKPPK